MSNSDKTYNVYGIGNALVDLEASVTDEFFKKNNIDKGLMTLVEEDRQDHLLQELSDLDFKKACGGSAANTIIAVSQFGGKSFYSCKVADDDFGHFYLADMRENGVDVNLNENNLTSGITGKCMVMVTPDAERTMNTFLGITSTFSKDELVLDKIKNSEYLYVEGYLVTSPTGQEAAVQAVKVARENNVKTALTFSDPNMVQFFKDNFMAIIGDGVDLLFCNEVEALTFTGMDSILDAREELKKYAKTFAITLGSNGATVFDGDTFIDIGPYKVEALDSNGAGDMFAGAFLYGITNGHTYASSGKLASLAASKVVSQFGPRLQLGQSRDIVHGLFNA
jgi:sugar/nucleoside kinase (ribokinase family)